MKVLKMKQYMTVELSSFLQVKDAELRCYTHDDLMRKISECKPNEPWYRLVLFRGDVV